MLVKEGESKIVEYIGNGLVSIKLKPTVYSFTYNRCGVVDGSDILRLNACKILVNELKSNGIDHSYQSFTEDTIISKLVVEEGFTPPDIQNLNNLPHFCPIEVVVKEKHVGTPAHRYKYINQYPTRFGSKINIGDSYPTPVVRFDWRNPNKDNEGNRLCDEAMADDFANFYINVEKAKSTAMHAFNVLKSFLAKKGLIINDICFFIDQSGKCIFSEISPDCMRVTSLNESLDKDVWRAGGSSPLLLKKWTRFLEMIS